MRRYPNTIRQGDVFLTYNRFSITSWLIAKVTYRGTGMWAHAAMAVVKDGRLWIQESTPDGNILTDKKKFFKGLTKWVQLRCGVEIDYHKLNREALKWLGTKYAWGQIWMNLIALMWKAGRGREAIKYFTTDMQGAICTEWIGKCYERVGVKIKCEERDGVYIPPQYLAPNEYIDSFQFNLVDMSRRRV